LAASVRGVYEGGYGVDADGVGDGCGGEDVVGAGDDCGGDDVDDEHADEDDEDEDEHDDDEVMPVALPPPQAPSATLLPVVQLCVRA
jgi:hypothetical protein